MSTSGINDFVKSNEKALFKYGIIAFMLWYILAALWFYKERVFFSDSGAQIFEMLLENDFKIYVSRYSMFVNQLLPYLFIQAKASIALVALAYSVSTPIITALALYWCYFKWNNKAATLSIMISAACTSQTFFHAISETMLLIPYTAVFYAYSAKILLQKTRVWYQYLVSSILLLLAFFIHPVSIFTLSFSILHLILISPKTNLKKLLPEILILGSVFLSKMFLFKYFTNVNHDKSFISGLKESLSEISSFFSFPIFTDFFRSILPLLWPAIILMTIVFFYNKKSGKKLISRLEGLFVLGFFILTILIYRSGDAQIGLERAFLPFAFFAGIMSSVLFKESFKRTHWLAIIPVACLMLHSKGVLLSGNFYHKRVQMLEEKIESTRQLPAQKFYTPLNSNEKKLIVANWALSVETLLLSSISEGEQKTIFILPEHIEPLLIYKNEPAIAFTPFWTMFYEDQLRASGYFEVSGKLYPLLESNEDIVFSGLNLPKGIFASNDKKILTKSKDNWQEVDGIKVLSLTPENPYQNVVELIIPANTKLSFSAFSTSGGHLVLESKTAKNKYIKSDNNSKAWQQVQVEYSTTDKPEEVLMYAYSTQDTFVNFKDIRISIHAVN